jgi:glycosyltransferase involved in cell wall biosynthesis
MAFLAGANSAHSWRWIDYFAERGHETHWISLAPFTRSARPELSTYVVPIVPGGPIGLIRAGAAVRKILAGVRPDFLHVHSVGTYGAVGALSGWRPMVATAWGSDVLLTARAPAKRIVIRALLARAEMVTCDALHMREALIGLGVPAAKIRLIYFGTDPTKFRPGVDGAHVRARFGLGAGPVIISLRSLEPIYDVSTLIRAMSTVAGKMPEARCLVVGDGTEREALGALVHSLGLNGTVFLAGAAPADEMPAFLAAADIYVSTSRSDAGLAASTAEAMASALPVVVTASAENHRWVAEGEGGFLIPPGDAEALASRILDLVHQPALRKAFGDHNRQVIVDRNNYFREMAKMEDLYREVAGIPHVPDQAGST